MMGSASGEKDGIRGAPHGWPLRKPRIPYYEGDSRVQRREMRRIQAQATGTFTGRLTVTDDSGTTTFVGATFDTRSTPPQCGCDQRCGIG